MTKLKKCVGKENLQRLNYLYQIVNIYNTTNCNFNTLLSTYYSNLMVSVSRKTVQRIEPNIKRNICKLCKNILLPSKNCRIRIKKGKIQYQCSICNFYKAYKTQRNYCLWLDNSNSIAEILDYSINKK